LVFLLEGLATLEFDFGGEDSQGKGKRQQHLVPGEYVYIAADVRHHVVSTSTDPRAVWLATHHDVLVGAASTCSSASAQARDTRLQGLLEVSREACESLSELVRTMYASHLTKDTTDKKADVSAFTTSPMGWSNTC